jgi:oxygen-independent coproporphyrinogen-3 oxidase
MLGLYIHVPFCAAICGYCNFTRGLLDVDLKRRYVSALEREIRAAGAAMSGRPVDSIFLGGGTPSLLEPAELASVLSACRESFAVDAQAEITLEANPESTSGELLSAFREAGVNRLSVGVQSFNDRELEQLGRVHSAARAATAIAEARSAGFDNVSLDLMLWLPDQTLETWMSSVECAIAIAPDHLSMYLLELYPNSPLRDAAARRSSEDVAADMYLAALDALDAAGFEQYEISNVARPGRASRHNLKYWQSGSWAGFGCGAHSTVDGRRWRNVGGTAEYIERIGADAPVATGVHQLSDRERIEEALFTGMRLSAGIDALNFEQRFGVEPWARYGAELAPYLHDGFVWRHGARFGLSRRGMLVANEILAAFVGFTPVAAGTVE